MGEIIEQKPVEQKLVDVEITARQLLAVAEQRFGDCVRPIEIKVTEAGPPQTSRA
jgi:hypothetical protein